MELLSIFPEHDIQRYSKYHLDNIEVDPYWHQHACYPSQIHNVRLVNMIPCASESSMSIIQLSVFTFVLKLCDPYCIVSFEVIWSLLEVIWVFWGAWNVWPWRDRLMFIRGVQEVVVIVTLPTTCCSFTSPCHGIYSHCFSLWCIWLQTTNTCVGS